MKKLAILLGLVLLVWPAHALAFVHATYWLEHCPVQTPNPQNGPQAHARVDPIVSPGVYPSAHMHDFFGNTMAAQIPNPNSPTYADMISSGIHNCGLTDDTSAKWIPTPQSTCGTGRNQPCTGNYYYIVVYYNGLKDTNVEPFPPNMEMVVGDAHGMGPNPSITYGCEGTLARNPLHPMDCSAKQGNAVIFLTFPNCWDGLNGTPTAPAYFGVTGHANDFASATGAGDGSCPQGFPHGLGRIALHVHLGVKNIVGITYSSGSWTTIHADYWQTWQQSGLDTRVGGCLNQQNISLCGTQS